MADELCGPSNALQNFRKHTSNDRTLQQDRLAALSSPLQGFRSASAPASSPSLLDAEFEVFQAGPLPLQRIDPNSSGRVVFPLPHAPSQLNPAAAEWSSDFQRLAVSADGAHLEPDFQGHPQQRNGGWHGEFAQQQLQPRNQPYAVDPVYKGTFSYVAPRPMVPLQEVQVPSGTTENFDEEAFARAFEKAAELDTFLPDVASPEHAHGSSPSAVSEEPFEGSGSSEPPQHERIGSDLIGPSTETGSERDLDAVARTAADLLERVKDNQSEKFQNSKFLQLMRQLRDGKAMIEGDRIVTQPIGDRKAAEMAQQ